MTVKNIVLVHGAWVDGSCWSKVIVGLDDNGFHATAVQLPLASFEEDVATVNRALTLADGPVVLVGHSYGGAVITEAGTDSKVTSLVYVAAFSPAAGESAGSLLASVAPSPLAAEMRPDAEGFLKMTSAGMYENFAQDLTDAEKSILSAVQAPTSGKALGGNILLLPVEVETMIERRSLQVPVDPPQGDTTLPELQKMRLVGATVAHDLNNLLTPILHILSNLQRERIGSPSQRQCIEDAIGCVHRASALTGQLLDISHLRPLQRTAVDLRELLASIKRIIMSALDPNVIVVLDVPGGLPAVLIDRAQMERAILNLIGNARDAMPNGGTLALAARVETCAPNLLPAAEQVVRLSISDTGVGMDEMTLRRAKQPFFSTKKKGTGLGLWMVCGFIDRLGGRLSVSSAVGQGTTIDIWLPSVVTGGDVPTSADIPKIDNIPYREL
jgi:signal transduction histidine kinase